MFLSTIALLACTALASITIDLSKNQGEDFNIVLRDTMEQAKTSLTVQFLQEKTLARQFDGKLFAQAVEMVCGRIDDIGLDDFNKHLRGPSIVGQDVCRWMKSVGAKYAEIRSKAPAYAALYEIALHDKGALLVALLPEAVHQEVVLHGVENDKNFSLGSLQLSRLPIQAPFLPKAPFDRLSLPHLHKLQSQSLTTTHVIMAARLFSASSSQESSYSPNAHSMQRDDHARFVANVAGTVLGGPLAHDAAVLQALRELQARREERNFVYAVAFGGKVGILVRLLRVFGAEFKVRKNAKVPKKVVQTACCFLCDLEYGEVIGMGRVVGRGAAGRIFRQWKAFQEQ